MDTGSETPPRRRRTKTEKRRIVGETFEPGASGARVARAHEVNANQVFRWRKLYREGLLEAEFEKPASEWLPVRLADITTEAPRTNPAAPPSGIDVELAGGRLRVEGPADPPTLRLLVELLRA